MTDTPPPALTRPVVLRATDFEPVTVVHVSERCHGFLRRHQLENIRFMLTTLAPLLRTNPPGLLDAQGSIDAAPHVSSIYPECNNFHGRADLYLVLRDPVAAEMLEHCAPSHPDWGIRDLFRTAWLTALEGTAGNRGRS